MSDVRPLDKSFRATFASGRAEIVVFPDRAREVWLVERYATHTDSVTQTRLQVYRGSELQGSRIDFTIRGNDAVSENLKPIKVSHGQRLRFVYSGGSVGATAEISVFGELEII